MTPDNFFLSFVSPIFCIAAVLGGGGGGGGGGVLFRTVSVIW